MPSFKHKTNKKIVVDKKKVMTLDGMHRELQTEFKMIEQEICKRYNIAIQYSKAYPKYLLRHDTGELICSKYGFSI